MQEIFLVLVIVQHRCQDMFIRRAGKISTALGQRPKRNQESQAGKEEVGKNRALFSLFLSIPFKCEFIEALLA